MYQSLASMKMYSNLAGAARITNPNIKFDEVKKVLKKWFSNALHGSGWSVILETKSKGRQPDRQFHQCRKWTYFTVIELEIVNRNCIQFLFSCLNYLF